MDVEITMNPAIANPAINTMALTTVERKAAVSVPTVRPVRTTLCLIGADVFALTLSLALSFVCRLWFAGSVDLTAFGRQWPILFLFFAVFAEVRLYSLVGLSSPEELRRSTISSALLLAALAAVSISVRGAQWRVEWPLFLTVALNIVTVPISRAVTRHYLAGRPWWGYPAIVVGTGPAIRNIIREMRRDTALGLKPAGVIEDRDCPLEFEGLPVFGTTSDAAALRDLRSPYIIGAVADIPQHRVVQMVRRRRLKFAGILLVQDSHAFSSLHINLRKVGGMFALEVPAEHVMRYGHLAKRLGDIVLTVTSGIAALPLVLLIALAIRRSSPGPVLYGQRRIGRRGIEFKAWKFRSMAVDADRILARHLEAHPEARQEWEACHKLKDDPRITRIGALLRKTSLDELPQLWNILMGHMSLVGPRPIVQAEVERYGDTYDLYMSVRGGLTGLWQVSGRSDTSYDERVRLDRFYVQNCSVWLDLCILFRTFGVVVLRKGAY
jgi:Undecaprenyl-phosphate galactose phosphotransferase WbaP